MQIFPIWPCLLFCAFFLSFESFMELYFDEWANYSFFADKQNLPVLVRGFMMDEKAQGWNEMGWASYIYV